MAEEEKKKKKRFQRKTEEEDFPKQGFVKNFGIAFRALDDPKKYFRNILLPFIFLGILFLLMPVILTILIPFPLEISPINFIVGGIIPIFIGIIYPRSEEHTSELQSRLHLVCR